MKHIRAFLPRALATQLTSTTCQIRILVLALIAGSLNLAIRLQGMITRGPFNHGTGRALIIGAYGNGNFGDDAVGNALTTLLVDRGMKSIIIAGRLGSDLSWRHHRVELVSVGSGLESILMTFRLARTCELVILGGGGLWEGPSADSRAALLAAEYATKALAARCAGPQLAIVGLGINANKYRNTIAQIPLRYAAAASRIMVVRSRDSLTGAHRLGARHALHLCDPALTAFEKAPLSPGSFGVCLLDRDRWPTFQEGDASSEARRDRTISALAQRLFTLGGPDVTYQLVPFDPSDPPLLQAIGDTLVSTHGARVNTIEYSCRDFSVRFSEFARCTQTFSQRFHPALAAQLNGSQLTIDPVLPKLESVHDCDDVSIRTLREAYLSELAWAGPGQ